MNEDPKKKYVYIYIYIYISVSYDTYARLDMWCISLAPTSRTSLLERVVQIETIAGTPGGAIVICYPGVNSANRLEIKIR